MRGGSCYYWQQLSCLARISTIFEILVVQVHKMAFRGHACHQYDERCLHLDKALDASQPGHLGQSAEAFCAPPRTDSVEP